MPATDLMRDRVIEMLADRTTMTAKEIVEKLYDIELEKCSPLRREYALRTISGHMNLVRKKTCGRIGVYDHSAKVYRGGAFHVEPADKTARKAKTAR